MKRTHVVYTSMVAYLGPFVPSSSSSVCPSVRPSHRPPRRRRPLSVHPVVRPVIVVLCPSRRRPPLSVRPSVRSAVRCAVPPPSQGAPRKTKKHRIASRYPASVDMSDAAFAPGLRHLLRRPGAHYSTLTRNGKRSKG